MQLRMARRALGGLIGSALVVLGVAGGTPVAAQTASACNATVAPGSSIQSAINARPRGATICVKAGTYRLSAPLRPRRGQKLLAEPGTVLEGGGTVKDGITNSAGGVTVRGFTIRNFRTGIRTGSRWLVVNNDVGPAGSTSVRAIGGTVVRNNYIHHGGEGGLNAFGANVVIEGNEIAYNHTKLANRCSGKYVRTVGLVVRGNDFHHNHCPALWVDINGLDPVIEDNNVHDNYGAGIDCEISYGCVIRNNTVVRNGRGILVSSSPDVQVYGNVVGSNVRGDIWLQQQGIRADHPHPRGAHELRRAYVHDNRVTITTGWVGIIRWGAATDAVWTSWGNRFEHNTYSTRASRPFKWHSRSRAWSEWKSYGHDDTGNLTLS